VVLSRLACVYRSALRLLSDGGEARDMIENALSLQDANASARQSECAHWQFVLALSHGQNNHSVQQPGGDEV
jgi:hypothetical protein